ncbi:hypothetical protein BU16DRAFT_473374, partial [Lophium mytilinum]
RPYITRKPGERYDINCLRPRFAKVPHTIVWGCFAGNKKGPLIIWNKKAHSNINTKSFLEHVYPTLRTF